MKHRILKHICRVKIFVFSLCFFFVSRLGLGEGEGGFFFPFFISFYFLSFYCPMGFFFEIKEKCQFKVVSPLRAVDRWHRIKLFSM